VFRSDFNTIVVSDGISMGTEGMKASLMSREAVRTHRVGRARPQPRRGLHHRRLRQDHPAAAMALARLDIPGLVFYGGTIAAGHCKVRRAGQRHHDQDVFERRRGGKRQD